MDIAKETAEDGDSDGDAPGHADAPKTSSNPIDGKLDRIDKDHSHVQRVLARPMLWFCALLILIIYTLYSTDNTPKSPRLADRPDIFHHLGQYSPYFPVAPYHPPPSHCSIDQVSILQRHGARWPTSGAARAIHQTLDKIHRGSALPVDSRLHFLKHYRYELGEEDLVPLGLREWVASVQWSHVQGTRVDRTYLPFAEPDSPPRKLTLDTRA